MQSVSIPPLRVRAPVWQRCSGFTLTELLVTVSIVAILAAVAYPAYTNSVIKGKRSEGRAALADLMLQQERLLTQTGTYLAFSVGATNVPFKTYSGDNSSNPAYRLGTQTCSFASAPGIRDCAEVFAEPQFTDTAVGTLWIRSTGEKGCTTGASVCWK